MAKAETEVPTDPDAGRRPPAFIRAATGERSAAAPPPAVAPADTPAAATTTTSSLATLPPAAPAPAETGEAPTPSPRGTSQRRSMGADAVRAPDPRLPTHAWTHLRSEIAASTSWGDLQARVAHHGFRLDTTDGVRGIVITDGTSQRGLWEFSPGGATPLNARFGQSFTEHCAALTREPPAPPAPDLAPPPASPPGPPAGGSARAGPLRAERIHPRRPARTTMRPDASALDLATAAASDRFRDALRATGLDIPAAEARFHALVVGEGGPREAFLAVATDPQGALGTLPAPDATRSARQLEDAVLHAAELGATAHELNLARHHPDRAALILEEAIHRQATRVSAVDFMEAVRAAAAPGVERAPGADPLADLVRAYNEAPPAAPHVERGRDAWGRPSPEASSADAWNQTGPDGRPSTPAMPLPGQEHVDPAVSAANGWVGRLLEAERVQDQVATLERGRADATRILGLFREQEASLKEGTTAMRNAMAETFATPEIAAKAEKRLRARAGSVGVEQALTELTSDPSRFGRLAREQRPGRLGALRPRTTDRARSAAVRAGGAARAVLDMEATFDPTDPPLRWRDHSGQLHEGRRAVKEACANSLFATRPQVIAAQERLRILGGVDPARSLAAEALDTLDPAQKAQLAAMSPRNAAAVSRHASAAGAASRIPLPYVQQAIRGAETATRTLRGLSEGPGL